MFYAIWGWSDAYSTNKQSFTHLTCGCTNNPPPNCICAPEQMFMFQLAEGASIENLRIRGASCNFQDYNDDDNLCGGVYINVSGSQNTDPISVKNCELSCFSYAGIYKLPFATEVKIEDCYIHKTKGEGHTTGIGYGTWMQGTNSLTNVNYQNDIFDDDKAAIDGQGHPIDWDINNCCFTQFFVSEDINRHNDNNFRFDDPDKPNDYEYHFCYNIPGTSLNCYYGSHCSSSTPACTTLTNCTTYSKNWFNGGNTIPIYDVGGNVTTIQDCIFHKKWKLGIGGSNINLTFPNLDLNQYGSNDASINLKNNTFAIDHYSQADLFSDKNRGGYARIANNYIESCVWNDASYIDYTSDPNTFSYQYGKQVSGSPQPSEFSLELLDMNDDRLPDAYNRSATFNHSFMQYVEIGSQLKVKMTPSTGGFLNYIIRPNPATNTLTAPLYSNNNYFYDGEIRTTNDLTEITAYDKPGLFGIDVMALDVTPIGSAPTTYDFKSSSWQHIPIIVNSNDASDERTLFFNIKDSYKETSLNPTMHVLKQVELNGYPIWNEDISEGGDGWEYIRVDLQGYVLNSTSTTIMSILNADGSENKLTFSIVIENSTVSTTSLKGLVVWIDDVYIKKYQNPRGENVILDGSVELSDRDLFSNTFKPNCSWYASPAPYTFSGCTPLRLISGANGETQYKEDTCYSDGSKMQVAASGIDAQAAITTIERRSGNQSLVLKIPAFKDTLSCTMYPDNNNNPIVSISTNFDYRDLLSCNDFSNFGFVVNNSSLPTTDISTSLPAVQGGKYILDHDLVIVSGGELTLEGCEIVVSPDVKIEVEAGGILNLTSDGAKGTNIFGCGNMWNGIKNYGGQVNITPSSARRCSIKDAICAIESDGGKLEIEYADFLNNYSSISLYHNNHSVNINSKLFGCKFDCTNGSLSKSPKTGLLPFEHIKLDNINISNYSFPIGESSGNSGKINYFSNAFSGINISNSKVNIYRNNFNDIYNLNNCYRRNYYGAAINLENSSSATNCYVNIGGVNSNEPNVFENVNIGVRVSNSSTACNTTIVNNVFDNSTWSGEGAGSYYFNCAIVVLGTRITRYTNTTGFMQIFGNDISDFRIGIQAINEPQLRIGSSLNNDISTNLIKFHLSAKPDLIQYHAGIRLQNCWNAYINGPTDPDVINIYNDAPISLSSGMKFVGIDLISCANARVNCNFISMINESININGHCEFSLLRKNKFSQYETAINLENAFITDQYQVDGSNNHVLNNEWLDNQSKPRIAGTLSTIGNIKWYYDNSANKFHPDPLNIMSTILKQSSSSYSVLCDDYTNRISRDTLIGNIVLDSIVFVDNIDQNKILANFNTLNLISSDTSILSMNLPSDSIYQNYYYNFNTNYKTFVKIMELSDNIDSISAATSLNSAISTVNQIEENRKTVFEIYLSKMALDSILNSVDTASLDEISNLTWDVAGDCHFIAAAFLGKEIQSNEAYRYIDYTIEPDQNNLYNSNNLFTKTLIYPNPTNSSFTVISKEKIKKIELVDVNSKVIYCSTQNLLHPQNISNVEPGLYVIKITFESNNFYFSKIVIVK